MIIFIHYQPVITCSTIQSLREVLLPLLDLSAIGQKDAYNLIMVLDTPASLNTVNDNAQNITLEQLPLKGCNNKFFT